MDSMSRRDSSSKGRVASFSGLVEFEFVPEKEKLESRPTSASLRSMPSYTSEESDEDDDTAEDLNRLLGAAEARKVRRCVTAHCDDKVIFELPNPVRSSLWNRRQSSLPNLALPPLPTNRFSLDSPDRSKHWAGAGRSVINGLRPSSRSELNVDAHLCPPGAWAPRNRWD